MSDEMQITFAQGTDIGQVRDHNEDSVAIVDPTDPALKRKGRLFIVADGMGGYLAGEVASQMAAETVQREYYADPADDPSTRLQNAMQAANAAVYQSAHADRAHSGMGTTMVATALVGHKAYVAAVGDSRAYIVHQGQLVQITHDHSFVGEQIRAGLLTKEQARMHPQRNVITRALGSQPSVQIDLFEGDLSEGDVLLICSDGLTGHVAEEHILKTLTQMPPEQAIKQLIQLANDNGGTDNITVIVLRVGPAKKNAAPAHDTQPLAERTLATPTVQSKPVKRGASIAWIVAGMAIVLIGVLIIGTLGLGVGGFWWWETQVKATPTSAATPLPPPTVVPLPITTVPTLPAVTPTPLPTTSPLPTPTKQP